MFLCKPHAGLGWCKLLQWKIPASSSFPLSDGALRRAPAREPQLPPAPVHRPAELEDALSGLSCLYQVRAVTGILANCYMGLPLPY